MQTRAQEVGTVRGFPCKGPYQPNHSSSTDKSTPTELSWANRSLGSRFTVSVECLLTPARAQPSTNCQHPLKSKFLPQLHLLSDTSSPGPETPKGTGDACAKSSHVRSCCLSGLQIQPVLEEMPTPSWWISELSSTQRLLSAIPGSPVSTAHHLLHTPKPLFYFLLVANLFCKYNSNELIYALQHFPIIHKQSTQIIFSFFSLHRQNFSFAPKMRSAVTQKMSKSCHGLLVQLNWRCIRASKAFQGSGKCFASLLCSFSPASGIHKFYPDGEMNCYSLYNLCFCERQFSSLTLGVWKPGS